jgi:simple sugar transport system ATP-binding protein
MTVARLELKQITKRYPAVVANDQVSLSVLPGEIHAVLGENGAGKSTLMKIIYGATKPDEGSIVLNGNVVQIRNPQAARAMGISMVFQHFSLFDTLTVAQNVWLGLGKEQSLDQVIKSIEDKAKAYGLDIDPLRPVHTLSVGEMQRVEIIRALLTNPQVLILDEPTSVLTPQAVKKLFVVLKQLASEGCSILYISHKLHEIRELCTACTVVRSGKVTGVCNPQNETNESLSKLMIGSDPARIQKNQAVLGEVVLKVNQLSLTKTDQFGVDLNGIELTIKAGEVLGIAGVSGNGQKELLYALSGEDTRAAKNTIWLKNTDISSAHPGRRRKLGLHFVPEERLGRGAVPTISLAQNLLLTRQESINTKTGWIDVKGLKNHAARIIEKFKVKAGGPDAMARSLSGGNLQKFIMGREIDASPQLLIVSQPTWGVDVGASAQIRNEILALRDKGCAVLIISEEMEELFILSDRLQVIAKGQLSPSIAIEEASVQKIGEWMSGLWQGANTNSAQKELSHV